MANNSKPIPKPESEKITKNTGRVATELSEDDLNKVSGGIGTHSSGGGGGSGKITAVE